MWPDMKIVHGRARHPQSQGSTERDADIIKNYCKMDARKQIIENGLSDVNLFNFKKNQPYHSVNKISPFETCFEIEIPMGLKSTTVPVEPWKDLK